MPEANADQFGLMPRILEEPHERGYPRQIVVHPGSRTGDDIGADSGDIGWHIARGDIVDHVVAIRPQHLPHHGAIGAEAGFEVSWGCAALEDADFHESILAWVRLP